MIKYFLFHFGVNLRFVFSIQFQTSIQWPTCLNALQWFRRLFTVQLQGIVKAFKMFSKGILTTKSWVTFEAWSAYTRCNMQKKHQVDKPEKLKTLVFVFSGAC